MALRLGPARASPPETAGQRFIANRSEILGGLRRWEGLTTDGGMNPTLATRCQQRQQQPYWRIHPPGPFVVDSAPPTALAVLLSGDGGGLGAGHASHAPDQARALAEPAEQAEHNVLLPAVSAGPIEAAPAALTLEGGVMAGPLVIRITKGPRQEPAPEPRAAAAPEAQGAEDLSPGPLRLEIPATPPEPCIAAAPAPVVGPLPSPLPHPFLVADGPALARARAMELTVELAAAATGEVAAPADFSEGGVIPEWLGTLLWLVLGVIDAGLALAELLQRLPAGPAKRDRGAIQARESSRFPALGRLRLRQPLGS